MNQADKSALLDKLESDLNGDQINEIMRRVDASARSDQHESYNPERDEWRIIAAIGWLTAAIFLFLAVTD